MDTTPFFIFLFIHLSSLVLGFGSVLVTDLYGLLWIRDRVRFTRIIEVSGVTERFIWFGWAGMVGSGIPLALLKAEVDNLMTIKLALVALIGVNGVALHFLHKKVNGCEPGDEVPNTLMFRLGLSLLVSQIAWWGAMSIGFLHRHVSTIIEWPDAPWLVVGLLVVGLLVIWGIGELVLRKEKSIEPVRAD